LRTSPTPIRVGDLDDPGQHAPFRQEMAGAGREAMGDEYDEFLRESEEGAANRRTKAYTESRCRGAALGLPPHPPLPPLPPPCLHPLPEVRCPSPQSHFHNRHFDKVAGNPSTTVQHGVDALVMKSITILGIERLATDISPGVKFTLFPLANSTVPTEPQCRGPAEDGPRLRADADSPGVSLMLRLVRSGCVLATYVFSDFSTAAPGTRSPQHSSSRSCGCRISRRPYGQRDRPGRSRSSASLPFRGCPCSTASP